MSKRIETEIEWNENGWTLIQEADAEEHKMEISCLCADGIVTEIRVRHNDGEETKGVCTKNGENILPLPAKKFEKLWGGGKLEFGIRYEKPIMGGKSSV